MSRLPNRLAQTTSPYLLQHADNPVDWNPWDEQALERARREDKPIFLSIGYAACHWCHVMERESFQNERIAELLNQHFVPIKVDREQRPDLDEIYLAATVGLTGSGGWPMSVFLTPELEPFFAGTYFPPEDVDGRPGFLHLITRVAAVWTEKRDALSAQARELTEFVRSRSTPEAPSAVGASSITNAVDELAAEFEPEFGGFGTAPKFPPHAALRLLLLHFQRTGDKAALYMVTSTLDGMKNGGIHDHLGGGFARYSTDQRWLVPHFEKMLYDNAELASVYLEAFQATGNAEYQRVGRETLDYLIREMQSPEGGFYSATDADSEGDEGKYFVFTAAELACALGPEQFAPFSAYYGVTERGQWRDRNILHTDRSLPEVADELDVEPAELEALLERAREKVLRLRQARVPPGLDDQVIASWNGLAIRALAEGYRIEGEPLYLDSARRAARFVLDRLRGNAGRLRRSARGQEVQGTGFLEDYAFVTDALVSLYEASGEVEWLDEASALGEILLGDFGDEGGFFQTAKLHEPLIARVRVGQDGALPNANATAARALARLSHHLDRPAWRERASAAVAAWGRQIERAPSAFATSLCQLDLLQDSPLELVLVGSPESPDTLALSRSLAEWFLPDAVGARVDPEHPHQTPLVGGKTLQQGRAALYLCRNHHCDAPLTSPDQIRAALSARLWAQQG